MSVLSTFLLESGAGWSISLTNKDLIRTTACYKEEEVLLTLLQRNESYEFYHTRKTQFVFIRKVKLPKQRPLSVHSLFCMWKPTSCANLHILNKLIKILLTDILIVINKINVFMWGYKDNFLNTSLKCKHYLCCFMKFFYSVCRNYDFVPYLSTITIFLKPNYSNASFTI